MTTVPSECTNAHTLDRHHPQTADNILLIVLVATVDSLTIVDAYLIVEQGTTVAVWQDVASKLDTDVASAAGLLTCAVSETRQTIDHVGIASPSLCDRVGGVLKCEGTLKLSRTDFELLVLHPFSIKVYQLYCRLTGSLSIGALNLSTPVEVTNLTV